MRFRSLLPLALVLSLAACRSKGTPAPAATSTLEEAPAPAGLLAELSVGDPKTTWQRARLLGGDFAQVLPSSLPVLLVTSLSLPPAAAGSLDESVPIVGVILARQGAAEPDVVLGMHVLSGAELVASLTLGDAAKFRRKELGPRVVRLVSAPGALEFNGALGVSGNYLLLATGVDALRESARFVAEGVSKRARNEPGLTLRATERVVAGALSRRLREAWQVRRSGLAERDRTERDRKGRAPDFADPQVLLAGADNTIESWLSVLESSRALSLSVSPEADRVRAEFSLTPNSDGAAALLLRELVVGSVAPLLQLPSGTGAALLMRGDAQPSEEPNGRPGDSIVQLFGERLNAEQSQRLRAAVDDFSRARRGATVVGFLPGPSPALLLTCELSDSGDFSDAMGNLLSLLRLPPVSGLVAAAVGRPSLVFSKSRLGVRHARISLRTAGPPSPSLVPKSLSLSWEAREGIGYIVISPDDALGLTPFAVSSRLASSEWLAQSQLGVTGRTALSVFADARLVAPGGPDDANLLLSLAKTDDQIVVTLDVASGALPAMARLFALDRSP